MQQNDTSGLPHKIKWITLCGLLMAINTIFSSFSVPVPGGHIYLNDIIIVIAALSLDPLGAFLVGGVGAFLGDVYKRQPHVRLPCHPRYPLRRHVPYRGQVWKRQPSCRSWSDHPWRPHCHRGIHPGQGLRVQHLGIRHAETPFRNTSGLHRIRHRTLSLEKQKLGSNDPPLPWVLTPYSP